jgi:(E)-4-hydroxy-3-methylbut-2-enyl-diphosphate synthase
VGDTIRVSLTEAPENEVPVAQMLIEHFQNRKGEFEVLHPEKYSPFEYRRRTSAPIIAHSEITDEYIVIEATSENPTAEWRAAILNSEGLQPVVTRRHYEGSAEEIALHAAADMGQLLLDGLADGVWIDASQISEEELHNIELIILQASRARFSQTEYIACPSCGRTLYNIEQALADIKARTSHLKGLKIGVMGCIVNGPGEMADADYGYVGAGAGRISLYKGKECIERNIPQEEALEHLINLIKTNGDWQEPV